MPWSKILRDSDPLTLTGDVDILTAAKRLKTLNLHLATATTLTIATGSVTSTQNHHELGGEGAAADDLDKIIAGVDAQLLLLRRLEGVGYSVTVRHNQSAAVSDNILLAGGDNYVMDGDVRMLLLMYDTSVDTNGAWQEVSRGLGAVAALTAAAPQPVDGTAAAVGVGTLAARDDHVHALGPLVAALDASQQQINSIRIENAATGPDAASEVEGQLFYDTDDDHLYLWVA